MMKFLYMVKDVCEVGVEGSGSVFRSLIILIGFRLSEGFGNGQTYR